MGESIRTGNPDLILQPSDVSGLLSRSHNFILLVIVMPRLSSLTNALIAALTVVHTVTGLSLVGPRLDPRFNRLTDLGAQSLLQGTGLEELPTSQVWVESNVPLLKKGGDFGLTCDSNAKFHLTFNPAMLDAATIARELLGTPLWIDQAFNNGCPLLNGMSFLGPVAGLTPEIKKYTQTDPVAGSVIIRPLYLERVEAGTIAFTAVLGDYHDIIGTLTPSSDPKLAFLQPGVHAGAQGAPSHPKEKRSLILGSLSLAVGLTSLGCRIANSCVAPGR